MKRFISPLNLVYSWNFKERNCLIVTPYIYRKQELIGIVVNQTVWALKDLKMSWVEAVQYLGRNEIGGRRFMLPSAEDLEKILSRGFENEMFKQTIDELRSFGFDADPLTADIYWSGDVLTYNIYSAFNKKEGFWEGCEGEAKLSLRPCLKLY